VIVALHGSGGRAGWMAGLGVALAERLEARVIAPDLRGHGPAPQRRGDVDDVGQLEDDVADLIAHLGREGREVVLLGRSGAGAGDPFRGRRAPRAHLPSRADRAVPAA
jgi:pimeloyl-ACP methyl ester carboxylesterase